LVTREEYDKSEQYVQEVRKAKANRQVKADSSLSYSDLVDWLRDNAIGVVSFRPKFIEAANAIEALMARIEDIAEKYNSALLSPVTEKMLNEAINEIVQLKAALKPFADMADEYDAAFPRPLNICLAEYPEDYPLWCRARTAYLGEKND
jgi:hypothetical protein